MAYHKFRIELLKHFYNEFLHSLILSLNIIWILFMRCWVGNRAWSVLILNIRDHGVRQHHKIIEQILQGAPHSLKDSVAKLIWLTWHCILVPS